ncbi:Smr/MutS family protein [Candidatus Pelagibacter sp.]|nr:Smr/MutS family protein [Candidatus Pelagibacter sp.]
MIKKITNKDKKDWKKFIDSSKKLENKDIVINKLEKNLKLKSIDLHGYTLENANKIISNFIDECYFDNINKIKVITGKGSRSKNKEDPYSSKDLSILKYSVPDYIKNNSELMKKIKLLDIDTIQDPNQGTFDIILKKFIR